MKILRQGPFIFKTTRIDRKKRSLYSELKQISVRIMKSKKRILTIAALSVVLIIGCSFLLSRPFRSFFYRENQKSSSVDILVFSYDRPMQLYACLESIYAHMDHIGYVSVVARVSSEEFRKSYEVLEKTFNEAQFIFQGANPKEDFKPLVMRAVLTSKSPYIAFAVDDIIVKDHVDLAECSSALQSLGAWGFYLRLGKNITHCYMQNKDVHLPPLTPWKNDVYSWAFAHAEGDWGYPNSVDMTIFSKDMIQKDLEKIEFHSPNSMESNWAQKSKKKKMGICYSVSKIVNVPLNLVNHSTNKNMGSSEVKELLRHFQAGLKMDIAPLYKMDNRSPHEEVVPVLINRSKDEIYYKRQDTSITSS